ncbi:hypothetical protein [Acinetobacter indicus]|uniref:hypothetical protein n=1 Tax=Acinetobacter indicus TaxID=756892 RepID=UPI000CEC5E72|nr:hypothetical protein [Acinetobacter indicus]
MKKLVLSGAAVLVLASPLANAEYYKVYIQRDDSNLYIDNTLNLVIKTKYCYEYSYGEDAILIYDKYSYSNQLVFKNGSKCGVDWIAIKQ